MTFALPRDDARYPLADRSRRSGPVPTRPGSSAFRGVTGTQPTLADWYTSLGAALDCVEIAAWVFVPGDERPRYSNGTAAAWPLEAGDGALVDAVESIARALAPARRQQTDRSESSHVADTRSLRTTAGSYLLRGCRLGPPQLEPQRITLVVGRRTSPAQPCSSALRERFGLTPRETDVARLVAEGLAATDVAMRLRLSIHTVRRHLERLYKKLGVHCRSEAQHALLHL
jgi:DNA-binding CsgD family transcriptional regulator